ncbi:MAG: YggS family pyridoxal phosphate-dependent enzyme [Actinomycetota bacterium]
MSARAEDIASNLETVRRRLADAATEAGRDPAEVRLIVVTKTVAMLAINDAIAAGARDLGENYVTELRAKRPEVDDPGVRWHYIGALQSHTAHHVADLADVVHTVAGERAARRLGGRAARGGRTLDALLEVDFTGGRAGVAPADVPAAADLVASLEGLRLRGLMTIAPATADAEGARTWFRRLRGLRDALRERHPDVLDLSMGMSLDYEVAVQEGATMVRIGTAVFGPRTPRPQR